MSADSTHTVSGQVSVKQEASVLGYNLLPSSRIRSRSSYLGINPFSSAAPRGGGSGGGLSRTLWSQGSHWVRSGARRLNLVTGLTSSRGNAGGMRGPSTAHPSASSPRLSSLMLTVPRSQLLSAAQRQRFSCLSSQPCRAATFQLLRQDGGGARMRLKPPDHTLVPRCCLPRQPPTTFVGAFFPARGSQGV